MTRLAMVGFGRIAPKHLEVFRAHGAEIVACCNRSPEGRRKAETEGGIARTYASIDEMIDRERPQGVICTVSMPQMFDAAREILPHGLPTLLEKPPGTSLDEYHTLCRMAAAGQTPVMVGLNRRHYSVVCRAVDDAGGLGAITAVSVEWSEELAPLLARGLSLEYAARQVFGNSLHGLDALTFLAGAVNAPAVTGLDLGPNLRWLMALQGVSERGALATFNSTWDSPNRWRLSFCAAGRRYTLAPLESCQVIQFGAGEPRTIEPDEVDVRFKPGFYRQAQMFLQTIATGEAPAEHNLSSVEPAMRLAELLTAECRKGDGESRAATARPSVAASNGRPRVAAPAPLVRRRQLRVVAIADSMSMARDVPETRWEETWPSRLEVMLRAAGVDAEVINCGARSRTADELTGHEFDEHVIFKQPDVIVVQVGIVDSAPRIFSRRERNFLNRPYVPKRLRDWIVRRRSQRRVELLRSTDPMRKVYTQPAVFAASLAGFGRMLAQRPAPPRLVVLPIVCNAEAMDRKSPGHSGNVARYNVLLRDFARNVGAGWIEPAALVSEQHNAASFADDGYHFTPAGCQLCAEAVFELIAPHANRAPSERSPAEGQQPQTC